MTGNRPGIWCGLCEDYPFGFSSAQALERHHNRAHATNPEVWTCTDPLAADSSHTTDEVWRLIRLLDECEPCKQQKAYYTAYNAASHLRSTHFGSTKRGAIEGAGKSGGDGPPTTWLKRYGWLKETRLGHAVGGDNPAMVGEKENRAMSDTDNRRESSSPEMGTSMNSHQQQYPVSVGSWLQSSISDPSHSIPVPFAEPTMTTQQRPVNLYLPSETQLPTEVPTVTQNLNVETALPDGGSETASDMSGNCYAESGISTDTVLDDDLLLNLAKVGPVARLRGTWFVDFEYQDLQLPKEFFAQVLLSNPRLSRLAYTAHFAEDECQVQWRTESVVLHEAKLPKVYTELVEQLDFLCLKQDGVKWYAHDSAYTIEGSNERYHLCLKDRCKGCAQFSSEIGSVLGK